MYVTQILLSYKTCLRMYPVLLVIIPISNFSSVRRLPTTRPQQDFSKAFCSCCCPPLLSCSFLVPLGLLSHYLSTSLVTIASIMLIWMQLDPLHKIFLDPRGNCYDAFNLLFS